MTKEFSASGFEQFQIAAVIDMIAEGAFGIGDPVGMQEIVWHEKKLNFLG